MLYFHQSYNSLRSPKEWIFNICMSRKQKTRKLVWKPALLPYILWSCSNVNAEIGMSQAEGGSLCILWPGLCKTTAEQFKLEEGLPGDLSSALINHLLLMRVRLRLGERWWVMVRETKRVLWCWCSVVASCGGGWVSGRSVVGDGEQGRTQAGLTPVTAGTPGQWDCDTYQHWTTQHFTTLHNATLHTLNI